MSASGPSGPLVSIFEWPLKAGFTVYCFQLFFNQIVMISNHVTLFMERLLISGLPVLYASTFCQ